MTHLTLRNHLETDPHIRVCLFLWFDSKDWFSALMVLVSGHKLEGKPFYYQSLSFSPPFLCMNCASSPDFLCVSSKWWIHGCYTIIKGLYQLSSLWLIRLLYSWLFIALLAWYFCIYLSSFRYIMTAADFKGREQLVQNEKLLFIQDAVATIKTKVITSLT